MNVASQHRYSILCNRFSVLSSIMGLHLKVCFLCEERQLSKMTRNESSTIYTNWRGQLSCDFTLFYLACLNTRSWNCKSSMKPRKNLFNDWVGVCTLDMCLLFLTRSEKAIQPWFRTAVIYLWGRICLVWNMLQRCFYAFNVWHQDMNSDSFMLNQLMSLTKSMKY